MYEKQESTFKRDLEFGQIAEVEFKELLESKGYQVEKMEGYFPDYDLKAIKDGITSTFEIKTDTQASFTGNVAIEIKATAYGVTRECGVGTSKADFYVFKLLHFPNWYVIDRKKLVQLIVSKQINRETKGGDSNRMTLALIDKKVLFANCTTTYPRKNVEEKQNIISTIRKLRENLK